MSPDPPPRVLVADDQADVLLALRMLLRDVGLEVDAASSVPEVRAKLGTAAYDLLLMDLNYARDTTSGEEGLALLADIHTQEPLLPVFVMTGWGSIDTAVEAMRRGACGFVHKPWDNQALADAIRREVEYGRTLRRRHDRASREQQEAQAIQRSLLPGEAPQGEDWELAARWIPTCGFGGDLCDMTPIPGGRIALSIGDVCGTGLPAALMAANVQASARAFVTLEVSSSRALTRLNRDLARHATLRRFVTFFLGIYEPRSRRLTYCNAGHNPPIVIHRDGSIERLEQGGPVLGAFEESRFEDRSIDLSSGDCLTCFTDGITEARGADDSEFGDERLVGVLRGQTATAAAADVVDAVLASASAFSGGSFQDDATVLVMSIR
jgi:serine phosphatase RsbU (regulator of sigma subunit)